jgi:hypothetical protein
MINIIMTKEKIIETIDNQLSLFKQGLQAMGGHIGLDDALFKCISLVKYVYGENSKQMELLISAKKAYYDHVLRDYTFNLQTLIPGILNQIKFDLENGLLKSIEQQSKAEVYVDMINLSKELLDAEQIEPAVVLACGAFEDCMKNYAQISGLDTEEKDLSEVINALKTNSLLQKPQHKIALGLVQVRNKAFHANWNKIGKPDIECLIAFVKSFITEKFK